MQRICEFLRAAVRRLAMRELQLYMYRGNRRVYLERHNFYVEQVRTRVLAQFRDIETEAQKHSETVYEQLAELPGRGDVDMSELADHALESGQERYELLSDLKNQMFLGAVAGMYHQWDKDLRDFIERELSHDVRNAKDIAWNQRSSSTFDLLKEFGWDCKTESFYPLIEACRLVVNVYKHGHGASLRTLAGTYPEYLKDSLAIGSEDRKFADDDDLDYQWLTISEGQFDRFGGAIRSFWTRFPERLFLTIP
jgi:hypothetical protein